MTPRETVWLALSDLFLDTDVSLFRDRIITCLQDAPFDLATLERIFIDEVYPVCISNLQQIAGEWAMFPEDWLFGAIEKERARWRPLLTWQRRARWTAAKTYVPEWFSIRTALVAGGKE